MEDLHARTASSGWVGQPQIVLATATPQNAALSPATMLVATFAAA
ncbi:MAG TPA: hypothetical protein VGQ92_16870 [Actinoplanes sp.]|nr:hypothetical protein [Actinoplanes sp.]